MTRKLIAAAIALAVVVTYGSVAYSGMKGYRKAMPFSERKQIVLKRHMMRAKILQEKMRIIQEAIGCIKAADTREELLRCLRKEKEQIQKLKEKYHRMIPKHRRP